MKGEIDLASLRLPQNFGAISNVKKELLSVPVKKPGKQTFIRVHPLPEYVLDAYVLDLNEEGETYLVTSSLWHSLSSELVAKQLRLAITRQGVLFLWPIKLPDADGNLDSWNQSAHQATEVAEVAWIRLSANRSLGAYEVSKATGEFSDPDWPDMTMEKIVSIAFRGKIIAALDHPVLRRLRGEI